LDALNAKVSERASYFTEFDPGRWGAGSLADQILLLQPDIVVSHVPRETIKILSSAIPNKVPVVVVAHHPESSERHWARAPISTALTLLNPRAALHIAVSSVSASGSQCRKAKRLEILPLGAEIESVSPDLSLWPSDCQIKLLSLSRLRKFKNLESLINGVAEVANLMRDYNAYLAIVGSGSEEGSLRETINRLNLLDVVSIHPAVTNPSGILRAADAMIISSTSEGGPITAMEALLAGTHVATTKTGLYKELIAHNDHLSIIQGFDAPSFARNLEHLIQRGPLSELERNANQNSSEIWGSKEASQTFYELLNSVITMQNKH